MSVPFTVKELVRLATTIHNATPKVAVPLSILMVTQDVIKGRSWSAKFHDCLTKGRVHSSGDLVESNKRHQHFISQLEEVQGLLKKLEIEMPTGKAKGDGRGSAGKVSFPPYSTYFACVRRSSRRRPNSQLLLSCHLGNCLFYDRTLSTYSSWRNPTKSTKLPLKWLRLESPILTQILLHCLNSKKIPCRLRSLLCGVRFRYVERRTATACTMLRRQTHADIVPLNRTYTTSACTCAMSGSNTTTVRQVLS